MHAMYYSNFKGILSKVVKENGNLDILVNNAGIGPTDDIEKLVSINLVSSNLTIKNKHSGTSRSHQHWGGGGGGGVVMF